MDPWYYVDPNNGRQGPVDIKFIRAKLGSGELNSETLVWRKGMVAWQPISAIQAQWADIAVGNGTDAGLEGRDTGANNEVSVSVITGNETSSPYAIASSNLSVGDATVVAGDQVVYAGFWRRCAAYVVDLVLLHWLDKVLSVWITGIFSIEPDLRTVGAHVMVSVAISVLLVFGYYAGFHASRCQATLGKMVVGIKVVRTDGTPITLARGIGRYFALLLSSFTMGVGLFMAAFTGRKQALHDMLCDTLVVDKWAFTDRPDLQQKGLGPVTIIVLVLFGLLLAVGFLLGIIMIGALISHSGGGS